MKILTGMAAIVMSGMLIAGTAFAQAGTGAGSSADQQAGSPKQETNQKDRQGGSTKQEANQKARGRADAGQPGAGERTSSGKDASADATSTGVPGADKQTVSDVQQALKDKGFDPGPVDGIMGPQTREAVKKFQDKQADMKATGQLNQQTLSALGVEGGAGMGSASGTPRAAPPPAAGGSATPGAGGKQPEPQKSR